MSFPEEGFHDSGKSTRTTFGRSAKEIFLALVDAQDHDMDVARSRSFIVQHFNVSESRVRQIEREGMDNKWPPLG